VRIPSTPVDHQHIALKAVQGSELPPRMPCFRDLGNLMQLLDQLDTYALQTQRAITIPLIKSMLETL
jgi:hypothetical protein